MDFDCWPPQIHRVIVYCSTVLGSFIKDKKAGHYLVWLAKVLAFSDHVAVQFLSCVQPFVTPWHVAHQASPSFPLSQSLLKFMSFESVMPSNNLILSHPLLFLPSIFPSIRVFSNELSLCIRLPKYWCFSFSINPSNKYSGLIRSSWCPRGSQSVLQDHTSKASILEHSVLFMVQLSHPYMTTGKTIALTIQTFISSDVSASNMLYRFVMAFLPKTKNLLISWLQSPSAVIWEPKKINAVTASTFSLSICHEAMSLDAMILDFWMLYFKLAFSLSSFSLIKRLFSSSSVSAIRVVSSPYLRLLIFLPAVLIPVCDLSRMVQAGWQ